MRLPCSAQRVCGFSSEWESGYNPGEADGGWGSGGAYVLHSDGDGGSIKISNETYLWGHWYSDWAPIYETRYIFEQISNQGGPKGKSEKKTDWSSIPKGGAIYQTPFVELAIAGGVYGALKGFWGLAIYLTKNAVPNELGNTVPSGKDVTGHIFRRAPGHVNPTSVYTQNRFIQLFEEVANNVENYNPNVLSNYQRTTGGFQGYSQTYRNGYQIWVQTRNGKIFDAGVNIIPK